MSLFDSPLYKDAYEQLEVALSSIKAVLQLEEKYNLKEAKTKIITAEEINRVWHGLNNLSRKCLEFQTPNHVFYGEFSNVAFTT